MLAKLKSIETRVTFERLRWELFTDSDGQLHNGKLPVSFNTSLKRALDSICKRPEIRVAVEHRRLSSIQEVSEQYPYKSCTFEVMDLRRSLLPVLAASETPLRYREDDNEVFELNQLSNTEKSQLDKLWLGLEQKLVKLLAEASSHEMLFTLIAKGKSYFTDGGLEAKGSFSHLVSELTGKNCLPPEVNAQLVDFSDRCFGETCDELVVRSFVHTWANVPKLGACSLKCATEELLVKERPDIVGGLKGYQPGRKSSRPYLADSKPTHSKKLGRLIDQKVFEKFFFIDGLG